MAEMVVDDGLRTLLGNAFNDGNQSGRTYQVCLYKSALAPAGDKVAADYTAIEAAFNGYARVDLTFPAVAQVVASVAELVSAIAVFQRTDSVGSEDMHGAFVLDKVTGELIAVAEDPAAPVTLDTQGQTYAATITWKLARG